MIFFSIIVQTLCLGLQWEVHPTTGPTSSGQLVSIRDNHIGLQTEAGLRELPMENVLRLVVTQTPKTVRSFPTVAIRLHDDSLILAAGFTWNGKYAMAPLLATRRASQAIPKGTIDVLQLLPAQIQSVRLNPSNPELDTQWDEIVDVPHAGDVLVIRKGTSTLDYLEGVIQDVDSQAVKFEFDGDSIDVPLSKLEGFLFHATTAEVAEPRARVRMADGSLWNVAELELLGDVLAFTCVGGVKSSRPLEEVTSVDLAGGKTAFLSDLDPTDIEITPKFSSSLQSALNRLIYAPKQDIGFGGTPLQLRSPKDDTTKFYDKGLALHSRTVMTYRIGGRYRFLQGWAGIAPGGVAASSVRLQIQADNETIFDESVRSDDEPRELDLPIDGKRELIITVDYGDETDVADRLYLCDIRVLK